MRLLRTLCLVALAAFSIPAVSHAQVSVGVSITVAPPPLPVYAQPPIPADGYLWIPGYWAYGPHGYYWVPGTWVLPPQPGLLWTPAYWAWDNGVYVFHAGYWGPHVGFYGGINYGYGYNGHGFYGGRWEHGVFSYNRAVTNIRGNVHVKNIYSQTVVNVTVSHASYNGGDHGVRREPTARQTTFVHEKHMPPTPLQAQHEQGASNGHSFLASANHGRPPVAATARPNQFTGHGVVAARGPVNHAPPHPQPQQHSAPPDHHDDHSNDDHH